MILWLLERGLIYQVHKYIYISISVHGDASHLDEMRQTLAANRAVGGGAKEEGAAGGGAHAPMAQEEGAVGGRVHAPVAQEEGAVGGGVHAPVAQEEGAAGGGVHAPVAQEEGSVGGGVLAPRAQEEGAKEGSGESQQTDQQLLTNMTETQHITAERDASVQQSERLRRVGRIHFTVGPPISIVCPICSNLVERSWCEKCSDFIENLCHDNTASPVAATTRGVAVAASTLSRDVAVAEADPENIASATSSSAGSPTGSDHSSTEVGDVGDTSELKVSLTGVLKNKFADESLKRKKKKKVSWCNERPSGYYLI